jgi:GTP-binding protein LepA
LKLNDASLTYTAISSDALGFGFRCGFLGMLHMEIVQERLEREHNVEVVQTAPTVPYEVLDTKGKVFEVDSAGEMPDVNLLEELREPIVKVDLIVPADSIGAVMTLADDRRAIYQETEYLSSDRVILTYEFPLAEIIYDFYDKLKSATRGYGTMDYEVICFRPNDLVKLDILVNNEKVDALSVIVHRSKADVRGRGLIRRLRKEISRHMFEIPLQAAIGTKVIARETISAFRKNVTAKCYGGDISRKRKLLEKQKAGKKRMKMVGNVEIPQKAFMAVLESAE